MSPLFYIWFYLAVCNRSLTVSSWETKSTKTKTPIEKGISEMPFTKGMEMGPTISGTRGVVVWRCHRNCSSGEPGRRAVSWDIWCQLKWSHILENVFKLT